MLYAASALAATLVGGILAWGLIDAIVHVSEAGVRAIASALILTATGIVAWRFAWPAWRERISDLATAQRIEARFPVLGDRLSSSLAFLAQDEAEPFAGSMSLRRAVVADTMGRADGLDFRQAVNAKPTLRIVGLAALVLLIAGALALANPQAARLVLTRTFLPWTSATWPRRHQLQFEHAPQRLATGADFEAVVVDAGGTLPERVTIVYEFDGDRPDQQQRREMKLLDGKMVHRLEGVTRSFRYRALGGDDDTMSWSELHVVEPPHITSLEARIVPPAYTGWPAETSSPDFRALEGSHVELTGETDQPITAAALHLQGPSEPTTAKIAATSEQNFRLPADPQQPWSLTPTSAFLLELTSAEGFTTRTSPYELRVVPDRPPVVVVETPADNTSVTASAVLPVRVLIKDDLAIARVELKYLRSDASDAGEQTIELFAGPEAVEPVSVSPLKSGMLAGDSRVVELAWNLGELANLAPGVTLTWHIVGSDYKPQSGVSPGQRLTIISQDELEDRIAHRQNAILLQLQDALRQQQKARSSVAALATQLSSVGRLGKSDLDQLQSAELDQRQVQRALVSKTDGVTANIQLLLAELINNRVDSPAVARRMQLLSEEIARLEREPLPESERALNTSLKIVRDDLDKHGDVPSDGNSQPDAETKSASEQAFDTAAQSQDEILTTLERLLGDLEEFDSYRRFARDISRLRGDQQALQKQTEQLQPRTLSKNVRDLSPQELAAVRRAAQQQTELARQLDKLISRMSESRTKLAESQPVAASTLTDALEAARSAGIGSQMLDTARRIEQNQLAHAAGQQAELAEALNDLADLLSGRQEHELGRRIEQLRETSAELAGVKQQLKGLKQRAQQAAKVPNEAERKRQLERLAKEEQQLAEQAQRLGRRLERLQSEKAGQQVSQAGDKSAQAGQASQQGDGEQALEDLAQAEKLLDEAQQQVQQDLAQAEQDLFFEQVAKLEQAIQGLISRQKSVLTETQRLETLKTNQEGEWTPSQRTSVRSVTEQQRDLVSETTTFAQKLKEAAAFGLALEGAVREMARATARLDRMQTDADTQAAEQIALARLEQLLKALEPEPPSNDAPPEDPMGAGGGGNQPQMPPGQALHLLAELKLLKLMQQEINRRTAELEERHLPSGELADEQVAELNDLAVEQGKLAELVLRLGEQVAKQAAAANQQGSEPPPTDKPARTGNNPLDEELNKSLDSELLPE